jgi:hypothetical protein
MPWFDQVHSQIGELVRTEATPAVAMDRLVTWCASARPHAGWVYFTWLGIPDEMPRLEQWLGDVLRAEPPAKTITAFWFGLFNPVDDSSMAMRLARCR